MPAAARSHALLPCSLLELAPETEALLQGVSGLYVMPDAPDATRFSVMWRVEGGRWMACLGGQEGQHPPLKDDHLMDFAEVSEQPPGSARQACQAATVWCRYHCHIRHLQGFNHGKVAVAYWGVVCLGTRR